MRTKIPFVFLMLLLVGCDSDRPAVEQAADAPWVRTVTIDIDDRSQIRVSGTVKGRYETPVSFQVPGRILSRQVDAGQRVEAGQLLFQLDKRDFRANVRVAEAELDTAEASLAIARSELKRQRQLIERNFVSRQTLESFELALQQAESYRDAARAVLAQAQNGLGYADLTADKAGVLAEVTAEPGQVVAVGQPLAVLIEDGALEVEVFLPSGSNPPQSGSIHLEGRTLGVTLREVAGAADPQSRTWRARYRIEQDAHALSLGAVVPVRLDQRQDEATLRVPLGALDERGQGTQVWQVVEGKARAIPVQVLALEPEYARIKASLADGSRVIALGTHLLTPGMAVREQVR